jgi:hypothetical protein
MRSSDLHVFLFPLSLLAFLALVACAVPLHDEGDAGAQANTDSGTPPPPPVASGCLALKGASGVDALSGAVRTIPRADGSALLVVDGARSGSADVPSPAFVVPATATAADCFAAATPLAGVGAAASALDPRFTPLAGVATSAGTLLFVNQPFAGSGVAAFDPTAGVFRAPSALLWTADRPAYGTAAVTNAGALYVFGCAGARFLDADCFVARVAPAAAADEAAYAYYTGGGN